MIVQILSSMVAGSILSAAYLNKAGGTSETAKIQEIFQNSGLSKRGGSIHLQRRSRKDWGTEYAYRLPLGLSFNDVDGKRDAFQDGLNNRRTLNFTLSDLQQLTFKEPLLPQIKWLLKPHGAKEIEMEYDGLLKIRVYNEPLISKLSWDESILKNGWTVPVGKSRTSFVYHDFEQLPNLLVAGTPGFGKSVFQKQAVASLIVQHPDDVRFTLIDLKEGVSFARFQNCKQVNKVACNPEQSSVALAETQNEMNEIYNVLVSNGYEDVREAGIETRHFVVIDEAADIADDKEIMGIIKDIARRGRAAGIRLIYSTQYPTTEAVPSQIKRNIPTRLSFVLDSPTASQAVLGVSGAEELPTIPGRAIYKRLRKEIVQCPFITNKEIKEVIKPHKMEVKHEHQNATRTTRDSHPFHISPTRLS